MPIIDKHKLIYLHVPKTGGSSIIKALGIWENKEALHEFSPREVHGIWYTPQHYTGLMLKYGFPKKFEQYKKFITVRNPYTRAVSCYMDKMRHYCPYKFIIEKLDKEHFFQFMKKNTSTISFDHFLPQVRYIGPFVTDHVIRFENLNQGFQELCRNYNIKAELPMENVSGQDISTDELASQMDRRTIDLINNVYKKDFEFFNYEKK